MRNLSEQVRRKFIGSIILIAGMGSAAMIGAHTYVLSSLASRVPHDAAAVVVMRLDHEELRESAIRALNTLDLHTMSSLVARASEIAIVWPPEKAPVVLIAGTSLPYEENSQADFFVLWQWSERDRFQVLSVDSSALAWYEAHRPSGVAALPRVVRRDHQLNGYVNPQHVVDLFPDPLRSNIAVLPRGEIEGGYHHGSWQVVLRPKVRGTAHDLARKTASYGVRNMLRMRQSGDSLVAVNPFTFQLSGGASIPGFFLELEPLALSQNLYTRDIQNALIPLPAASPLHVTFALPKNIFSDDRAEMLLQNIRLMLVEKYPKEVNRTLPDGSDATLTIASDRFFPVIGSATTGTAILRSTESDERLLSYESYGIFNVFSTARNGFSTSTLDVTSQDFSLRNADCLLPTEDFPFMQGKITTIAGIFPKLSTLLGQSFENITLILDKNTVKLCIT